MHFLRVFRLDLYLQFKNYSIFNNIFTFSLIVLFTNDNAIPENIDNLPAYLSASYLHNFYKFENGESRTRHPI
jgi:hypothetical protein